MIKKNKLLSITFLVIIYSLLFVGIIFAAAPGELNLDYPDEIPEIGRSSNMGWLLFRYILTVLAVIALTAFGAKYIAEKFRPETTTSGNWVQILDQVTLGSNKGLMLVDIEGKGYVLGVSDNAINIISTIEDRKRLDELRTLTIKTPEKNIFNLKFFRKNSNKSFNQSFDKYIERSLTLKERGRDVND